MILLYKKGQSHLSFFFQNETVRIEDEVNQMIIIHATFHVRQENRDLFQTESVPLITGSRMESGNIRYTLYEDPSDRNSFILVEEWKDEKAVQRHRQSAQVTAFMARADLLFDRPTAISCYSARKLPSE